MEAAGAYIRAIRDGRELSRADVSRVSKVHESQIARLEAGVQDVGYSSVLAVVEAIKGSAADIQRLVINPRATVEDAIRLADAWLHPPEPLPRDPRLDAIIVEEIERKRGDGHGAERVRAAHILEDLIGRPDLLDDWLKYGDYLVTQKH